MIYFTLIVASSLIFLITKKYSAKYYIWITFILLFLLAACRNITLWNDLIGYERKHIIISNITEWKIFLSSFLATSKDVGYYILEWLLTRIGISFQEWIALIAAFFLYVIGKLIYKKSYYPLISVMLFLALGFYSFSMSGLRQTIAIAITVIAYFQLDKGYNFKFILLVCIATLFHKTACIFIILLFLKNIRLGKFHILGSIAGLLGFFIFNNQLRAFLNTYFFTDNYSFYSTSSITLNYTKFIILVAIFIFCIYYYKPIIQSNIMKMSAFEKKYLKIQNPLLLYNSLFLGVIFQLYSSFFAEMFRVSMYFSLYSILLVPLCLKTEKNEKVRFILNISIYVVLFIYIMISGGLGVNYQTF